jgi:hypothetical protein
MQLKTKTTLKMKSYIFCFDLHKVSDTSVYESIEKTFVETFPASTKVLNTTYFFKTTRTDIKNVLDALFERYIYKPYSFEYICSEVNESNIKGGLNEPKPNKVKRLIEIKGQF